MQLEVLPRHVGGHRGGVVVDADAAPADHRRRRRRSTARSGSSATPAVPRSLATRPQYGSSPNHEHFTSWLSATLRAAGRASSSDAAPVTRTLTTLVWPSASPTICVARSRHASATAAANASGSGAPGAAAGQDQHRVVGRRAAVDGHGVEAVGHARPQRAAQRLGLDRGVGGEHRQHRGHVRAPAWRRPWPCRRRRTRRPAPPSPCAGCRWS